MVFLTDEDIAQIRADESLNLRWVNDDFNHKFECNGGSHDILMRLHTALVNRGFETEIIVNAHQESEGYNLYFTTERYPIFNGDTPLLK